MLTDRCMDFEHSPLLFVYGTLKQGSSNHHWMDGAHWQGRARLAGYRLHNLGDYPMAVPGRGVVHGEVYAVQGAALGRLDRLEDVPNEYQRQLERLEDGRQAYVYVGRAAQVQRLPKVPYGDWDTRPVFCYGSDLDPGSLRRRYPAWDGTAWPARLPGWRWRATGDALCRRGIAAWIEPDPGCACWGVVIHERDPSGSTPQRLAAPGEKRCTEGRPGGGIQRSAKDSINGRAHGGALYRAEGRPEDGWRTLNLRLQPWQGGSSGAPVGATARLWCPGPELLPGPQAPGGEERDARECRRRLLAGAIQHGLPEHWCQMLRQALEE